MKNQKQKKEMLIEAGKADKKQIYSRKIELSLLCIPYVLMIDIYWLWVKRVIINEVFSEKKVTSNCLNVSSRIMCF